MPARFTVLANLINGRCGQGGIVQELVDDLGDRFRLVEMNVVRPLDVFVPEPPRALLHGGHRAHKHFLSLTADGKALLGADAQHRARHLAVQRVEDLFVVAAENEPLHARIAAQVVLVAVGLDQAALQDYLAIGSTLPSVRINYSWINLGSTVG